MFKVISTDVKYNLSRLNLKGRLQIVFHIINSSPRKASNSHPSLRRTAQQVSSQTLDNGISNNNGRITWRRRLGRLMAIP